MRQLPLANGGFALVDEADLPKVAGRKWRANNHGHAFVVEGGKVIMMHRLILGAREGEVVDHMNRNPWDNRRENLRLCSHAENMRNRKIHRNNRSGYKGVYLDKQRNSFRAQIRINGKKIMLGWHKTAEAAHAAYVRASHQYHGEFACAG